MATRADPVPSLASPLVAAGVVAGGCLLLAARPLLVARSPHPDLLLALLFAALLSAGALWPGPGDGTVLGRRTALALAVGLAAFAGGRLLGGGHPPLTPVGTAVAANTLAAVAEEAFFRRLVYGLLEPHGARVAVLGSTVAFAAVHVTVYGWWVLPLDLAAGALLSWQRWATGGWAVPALTHVFANLLVVL